MRAFAYKLDEISARRESAKGSRGKEANTFLALRFFFAVYGIVKQEGEEFFTPEKESARISSPAGVK